MDEHRSRMYNNVWVLTAVAVSYFVMSHLHTLFWSEEFEAILGSISFIVSFFGGFLFIISFIPLTLAVIRLIKREHLGNLVFWPLFIGFLWIADIAVTG